MSRRVQSALALFAAVLALGSAADLPTAAAENDAGQLRVLLGTGADAKARDAAGDTALHRAVRAGAFEAARELLWQGADPGLTNAAGKTALDLVPDNRPGSYPLAILLRLHRHLPAVTTRAAKPPAQPTLVMLYEPTVNYLHPRLKAAYHVNEAERTGRPEVDDDANGFIDDVYGYNLVSDRGHEITPRQLQTYLENRKLLGHLFDLHNRHERGELSDAQYLSATSGYNNPIALMFGASSGFNDRKFLELAIGLSHGSHVGGIVLDHARGAARLHTLSWEEFEYVNDLPVLRRLDHEKLAAQSADLGDFLEKYRQILRDSYVARGRRASAYLQATGAGIANLSMGSGLDAGQGPRLAATYARFARKLGRPVPNLDDPDLKAALRAYSFELYVARAAEYAAVFYENPDVLFVCSAGNDAKDNDATLSAPAYLGRMFPNVLTVAAVDAEDRPAAFTNRGLRSVDLAAPGVGIVSTAIPESPVIMDGTSMATPAVAGAAAYVRAKAPGISAAQLRRLLLYATRVSDPLNALVVTSGVLDEDLLFATVAAEPAARAEAFVRLADRATALAGRSPGASADALWLLDLAAETAPQARDLWEPRRQRARQVLGLGTAGPSAGSSPEKPAPAASPATLARDYLRQLSTHGGHPDRVRTILEQITRRGDPALFQALIHQNLRMLGAAADQHYLENGVNRTTYDALVGPGKIIAQLHVFAGEDYRKVTLAQGQPLVARTAGGLEVRYDP